jgi:hypothetical protein
MISEPRGLAHGMPMISQIGVPNITLFEADKKVDRQTKKN